MSQFEFSRRQTLAALAASAAMPLLRPAEAFAATPDEAAALALLDSIADNLLILYPEGATGLGIDTGARAGLRSQLEDRSAAGQRHIAEVIASTKPASVFGAKYTAIVAPGATPPAT